MAIPLENIKSYVDALVAAGGTNADIKAAMDLYGVSPGQLAAAYNADPATVQAEYNRVQASPASRIQTFEQTGAAPTAQPNLRGQVTSFPEGTGTPSTGPVGGTARTTVPATTAVRGQATSFPEGTGTPSTGPVGGTVRTTTSQPSSSITISPESFNTSGSLSFTGPGTQPATGADQQTLAERYSTEFFNAIRNNDRQTASAVLAQAGIDFPGINLLDIAAQNVNAELLPPSVVRSISGEDNVATANELRNYILRMGTETSADLAPVPSPVTVPSANIPGGYAPLPAAPGESRIDPIIRPYLEDALGKARSLFEMGQQPQLYPGQMFVSPSAETLESLGAQTDLARMATPFYQQAAEGLDVGLRGLETTASGAFLGGSPYRDAMISAATRPLTQQFTEEVMPGIQSTFSRAGRLGSGAQGAVTGRATEGFTRALGDVTSRIAAEDYARERGFQEEALRDVISGASNLGNVYSSFLAPSTTLANVGAQREAIAGQPLQESIRRFDYAQNLPQQQLANYVATIYGSPLGGMTAGQPQPQGNTTLQNIGDLFSVAQAIPTAVGGVQQGYDFVRGIFNRAF